LNGGEVSRKDATADYLIDDLLVEVQTIKEAIVALEQKLKKLKP